MTKLKQLLDNSYNEPDLQDQFKKIAKELMCNYVIQKGTDDIQKGSTKYAIVEIEFYYNSKSHPDHITYPRYMVAGRWFFHQSGVDLTFTSNKSSFGGILIRGIKNIETGDYIFGPQKCVNILWDNFDAFGITKTEYPILIEQKVSEKLYQCKRHINIKDKTASVKNWLTRLSIDPTDKDLNKIFEDTHNRPYRFFYMNEDPTKCKDIPSGIRPKGTKHIE
ncbi:MAG: hypothetical protein K2N08_00640 [Muribaculaceae bacterium]|nr:hypothetical protein [Muribaculaceae bacterium]